MILKGNSRGHAKDLALHLMNDENENVEIHAMRGFISRDLMGAFHELYAISRGTRCDQFMYSLSLNPPPHEEVSVADFEDAIEKAEQRLGLQGQARAIVFHEKQGRRHCHVVWSRIDLETMKAKQMSFDHEKLMILSRELFLHHGWEMPRGFQNKQEHDPLNYTHSEYQHAKRLGKNAAEIKRNIRAAWLASDCRQSLEFALSEKGYFLARGDRRGFVVIDRQGEIYSLPRYAGVKTKEVRERLGDEHKLPSVDDILRLLEEKQQKQDKPEQKLKISTPDEALQLISTYHASFTTKVMDQTLKPIILNEETRHLIIRDVLRHHTLVKIGERNGQAVFATQEMINLEKQMVLDSKAMAQQSSHKIDAHAVHRAIFTLNSHISEATGGQAQLSQEQITAIKHMASDRQLSLIVGVAGAGKTTVMQSALKAYEQSGYRVLGAAPSGIAASSLQEIGVTASTLHSLEYRLKLAQKMLDDNQGKPLSQKQRKFIQDNSLTHKDVLIIDEAGMVSSKQMAHIISLAKQAGTKIILVGDHAQLQSIEAGTAFKDILKHNDHVTLSEVRRQKSDWQRQATIDLSQGNIADAIKAYDQHGNIQSSKTRTIAKEQLVHDLMQAHQTSPDTKRLVLAYTRKDVHDLNQLIKAEMVKHGRVKADSHEINVTVTDQNEETQEKQGFAIGDRILFRKNDAELGVMNGSFGTLKDIRGDILHITLDNGKDIEFSSKDYNHLQLGYATTVHKSQGITVDETYVLATPHFDKHTTYVAMSRHQDQAKIYTAQSDFNTIQKLGNVIGRDSNRFSTLDFTMPKQPQHEAKPHVPAQKSEQSPTLMQKLSGGLKKLKERFFAHKQKQEEVTKPQEHDARAKQQPDHVSPTQNPVPPSKPQDLPSLREKIQAEAKKRDEKQANPHTHHYNHPER